jgi:hypothetical protein
MPVRQSTRPRTTPPLWTPPPAGTTFMRGARPSSIRNLMMAVPFTGIVYPAQFGIVPAKLSIWGNSTYGDCVSAEEWFAKACHTPEIFLDDASCVAWAKSHGFLNGADLSEVMDAMAKDGPSIGGQQYLDGGHQTVDWSNEDNLRAAITQGTVKIAIDANTLPSGAGNAQGWYALGGQKGSGSDHCVALSGYGPAQYLFALMGVPLPSAVQPTQSGYILFTWSTCGFVDHPWLMNTCTEAHLRVPTTVGVPPIPDPVIPLDPNGW